jgi:release factor glutamine methyltransferase
MGTGSGILSETASKFLDKKNILAADINPKAVKLLKQKNLNAKKSNLFEKIKSKFDLITFNAPYLPRDPREPKDSQVATTGGKRGDEISLKFLKQAKEHLNKNGKILLLISSLTPMDKIKKFKPKTVAKKKIFMEELLILEFS